MNRRNLWPPHKRRQSAVESPIEINEIDYMIYWGIMWIDMAQNTSSAAISVDDITTDQYLEPILDEDTSSAAISVDDITTDQYLEPILEDR